MYMSFLVSASRLRVNLAGAQSLEVEAPSNVYILKFVQMSSQNGKTYLGVLR